MSYRRYRGSKSCAGCGKPGTEVVRRTVDALCYSCEKLIDLGKRAKLMQDREEEYVIVSFYTVGDRAVNEAMCTLLENIRIEDGPMSNAESVKVGYDPFSNSKGWGLMTKAGAAAFKLMADEVEAGLKRMKEQGMSQGQNLLIQLNTGELTVEQLSDKNGKS